MYVLDKNLFFETIHKHSRAILTNPSERLEVLNDAILNNKWAIGENTSGLYIYSNWIFPTAQACIRALIILDEIQEEIDHDATFILNDFQFFKIQLCTHSPAYGISELDFQFAEFYSKQIESLIEDA